MTNISGTEITGVADPMNMFIAVGIIFAIGIIALIGWAIYQAFT